MCEDLLRLLENGETSRITIQITGEELMSLIRETAKELSELSRTKSKGDEDYLPKKEVMAILGVCDTTLWLWAKNNYLKPAKAGRKVMYRKSDVLRLLETKEDRV
ncbi:MAG: helix-turn-helix domain-containing protein [Bacteroidales bacterium]|nr:helix-turn-helix domain-containing protein [Bacteroidales bacterium]